MCASHYLIMWCKPSPHAAVESPTRSVGLFLVYWAHVTQVRNILLTSSAQPGQFARACTARSVRRRPKCPPATPACTALRNSDFTTRDITICQTCDWLLASSERRISTSLRMPKQSYCRSSWNFVSIFILFFLKMWCWMCCVTKDRGLLGHMWQEILSRWLVLLNISVWIGLDFVVVQLIVGNALTVN